MSELYKITFGQNTGLCRAVDADDAGEYMDKRIGLDNGPVDVDVASDEDEAWFKGMGGGYIYETPAARAEDKAEAKS